MMAEITTDEWMDSIRKEQYPWMTDDQFECLKLLCDLFGGHHHLVAKVKKYGTGIEYNTWQDMATYDFDGLTRLVVMCHDRMTRAEIKPSGPGKVKIALWKRHTREGSMDEKHPTIEDAIIKIRANL